MGGFNYPTAMMSTSKICFLFLIRPIWDDSGGCTGPPLRLQSLTENRNQSFHVKSNKETPTQGQLNLTYTSVSLGTECLHPCRPGRPRGGDAAGSEVAGRGRPGPG